MKDFNKARMFFRPFLKEPIDAYQCHGVEISVCREILSDSIPLTEEFIVSYLKAFPKRFDTRIFDLSVDKTVREIMHDIILRHACEYLRIEIDLIKKS